MQFEFPLEITTLINRQEIAAIIFETFLSADKQGFKVRFEDGFEDIFYLAGEDGDLGPIAHKPNWEPYALALRADLLIISNFEKDQLVHVFRHKIDGVEANIWITEEYPNIGRDCFYVHYNQYCRFQFDKNEETGNWRILKNYAGDTDLNLDLVRIAGGVVEGKMMSREKVK